MKAMVLAAGQGTRLRPITDRMPKALVPVAGRPMIEYALLLLRHYGIRDIVINLHHFGQQIENYLGDGAKLGVNIKYSQEPELLDTGGGLLKAKAFLQDDTFIVINTDALIDVNLAELIDFHRSKNAGDAGAAAGRKCRSIRFDGYRRLRQDLPFSRPGRRSVWRDRSNSCLPAYKCSNPKFLNTWAPLGGDKNSARPNKPIRKCCAPVNRFLVFASMDFGRILARSNESNRPKPA